MGREKHRSKIAPHRGPRQSGATGVSPTPLRGNVGPPPPSPWQAPSIAGMVHRPAGPTRPAGRWNRPRVRCHGRGVRRTVPTPPTRGRGCESRTELHLAARPTGHPGTRSHVEWSRTTSPRLAEERTRRSTCSGARSHSLTRGSPRSARCEVTDGARGKRALDVDGRTRPRTSCARAGPAAPCIDDARPRRVPGGAHPARGGAGCSPSTSPMICRPRAARSMTRTASSGD